MTDHLTSAIAITIGVQPHPQLPAELSPTLTDARRALWQVERELWSPRVLVARDAAGTIVGATLTAGRPHCRYRKIVDVVADGEAAWQALVKAARDDSPPIDSSHPTPLVVHFEEHLEVIPLTAWQQAILGQEGFNEATRPVPSIPSTQPGDPSHVSAWSWWATDPPQNLAPYFGQTTEVTCGAVSSLMALESRGHQAFTTDDVAANRGREIAFWRRANNLPACEPVGLAVEIAESGMSAGVLASLPRVHLSTPDHVLLEEYEDKEFEKSLRVDLQEESRRQAKALGIGVDERWMEVSEIMDHLRHGSDVLLLIDLTPLIGDPTPHWILATDVVDDTIIVSDPWVNYMTGETWVDTFALPVTPEGIDVITRWGDPPYRGVIVLPGHSGAA
jgi:hypothetical protein